MNTDNQNPYVEGTLHRIGDKQTFNSGFEKQEIVIDTGGKYPQLIPIEFVKSKIEILNNLTTGSRMKVFYNLRGREHNGRFYVNLQGWRIEKLEEAQQPATAQAVDVGEGDEIPF